MTIEEIDQALSAVLAAGTGLKFATNFLLSDEIVVEAVSSSVNTPQSTEAKLKSYKLTLAKTVARLGLAKGASLCHVEPSLSITRREGDASTTGTGGWNAVASRGSWRKTPQPAAAPTTTRSLVALKRTDWRKKGNDILMAPVDDDWLEAAEKLEEDEVEDQNGAGEKENVDDVIAEDRKSQGGEQDGHVAVEVTTSTHEAEDNDPGKEGQEGQVAGDGTAMAQDDKASNVTREDQDGRMATEELSVDRGDKDNTAVVPSEQQEGQITTVNPAEVASG